MSETLVLDPSEVATDRTEVDLTFWVGGAGVDWGDAGIEAAMATGTYGQVPVDYRVPNRIITVPLTIVAREGVSFDTVRRRLQAKVGLWQRKGGWIKREYNGTTVYADVVSATLKLGGSTYAARGEADTDGQLTIECLPDWYGDEITLDSKTETTATGVITVLKQGGTNAIIEGDYPGRTRVAVNELSGHDQLGLLLGFRPYDSAPTAALAYEAEALTPLDAATLDSFSGHSGAGNNAVFHDNLGTDWTPVLATTHATAGDLTHVGAYRVWARLRSVNGPAVQARLVWDIGDMSFPKENDAWIFPAASNLYLADLGEIRIDRVPVGAHRWRGHIQAKGTQGGESITIDKLEFQPLDDSACRATAADTASLAGMTQYVARDTLQDVGGNLGGHTAAYGGDWATSGSATDFAEASGSLRRSTTSDSGSGRFGVLGTNAVNVIAGVTVAISGSENALLGRFGVAARYTDANNYIELHVNGLHEPTGSGDEGAIMRLVIRFGGAEGVVPLTLPLPLPETVKLELAVFSSGRATGTVRDLNGAIIGRVTTFHSALAAGGAIAAGKGMLHDFQPGSEALTRTYSDFYVASIPSDAAVFANQSAELRTDGLFREDAAGAAYGPISRPRGPLPRIPPSGLEQQPIELFLRHTRGDLDQLPDGGLGDDISVQVHYRPCSLILGE